MLIDVVRAYLALLKEPPSTAAEAVRALARTLDRLALAYHETSAAVVEDDSEPPTLASHDELRAMVARAFPEFGFYAVARPHEVPPSEALLGDAIDDLADIAGELVEVDWRWVNNGPVDAMRQFRWGYQSH
ncbi:MAG: hypothetical protein FJX20_22860 [Alphaproteobacteria bacterium]|nr:hypothetical protein [Alphaproteobacteria bacterium]